MSNKNMAKKITKISDTELEIELEPEKYIMTKEVIKKGLQRAKDRVKEYQDLLKKFDE